MSEPTHLPEKQLASAILIEAAGRSSANIDRFSGWILAGYAGAITFLLSNSNTLGDTGIAPLLPAGVATLVAVLALAIVQKLIAVPPRKGLLAPMPSMPAVLLNGTFVNDAGCVYDQKPDRSELIFNSGWT